MKTKENNRLQLSLNFEVRPISLFAVNGRNVQVSKVDFSTIHYIVQASDSYPQADAMNSQNSIPCISVSYKNEPGEPIGAKIIDLMDYKRKSIIDYVLNHTKSF